MFEDMATNHLLAFPHPRWVLWFATQPLTGDSSTSVPGLPLLQRKQSAKLMCTPVMLGTREAESRRIGCQAGAGTRTLSLHKSSNCSQPLSHLQPLGLLF